MYMLKLRLCSWEPDLPLMRSFVPFLLMVCSVYVYYMLSSS